MPVLKKISNLYDQYLVDQFVDRMIQFYRSPMVHYELTTKLSEILSCPAERFEGHPALYYRMTIAKLVLESVCLTSNQLGSRVSTMTRGRTIKKHAYLSFRKKFFRTSKASVGRDPLIDRLTRLIPKYEQTCKHSGVEGLGELLLAYIEGRFQLPPRWIRKKRSLQIIDALDTTGFNDFWVDLERSRSDTSTGTPTHRLTLS